MIQTTNSKSGYYENQPGFGGLVSNISWYARKKMFNSLIKTVDLSSEKKVLDVGVTCDRRQESNFFEKLYPYPENITAVGLEDASFLEQEHPGLTFVKTDGSSLPFADKSFDLVVSFAVIEHVGNRDQQRAFISELCRVGRTCFITTPNRWYPIEFHTALPLVHWLPPSWFRTILKWLGNIFYSKEESLNLLSESNMLSLFPADSQVYKKHFRLFGLISNLVFYLEN
ncbi:class I SAM-dependent methyltransferase [Microseira sp. BLCC-F43]|jgi:2-polyprenyl-3-methyl-5-hydroxy-6-metoxy-1,4-benzoquinol methylase|uniref:class I SAM-dependent methyltransferase n=1 Tax=Microseira sp. BLCC-F43 TaxID=3153602 RepID=UPI0035B70B16